MTFASPSQIRAWLQAHQSTWVQSLVDFLKIPSISTDPAYSQGIQQAHDWLYRYLESMHFEVKSIPTSRYPVLMATHHVSEDLPTVLIYNHYDVQPVDPLELWLHPPFEPYIDAAGEIFARGAQDNKGQLFGVLAALQALQAHGTLPCNLTLCIEGEEECGSKGLSGVLENIKESLKADVLLVVDVDVPSLDKPAVTTGCRGNVTMTFEIIGSKDDLHSGMHGGIVYNPNHAMVEVLAQLRDPATGRILIDGFYDEVEQPDEETKKRLYLDFDEAEYVSQIGAAAIGGEKAFSPLESCWLRPTLEINGLAGGYSGEGFKTVIPAKALAKISCRLVANQDVDKIRESVKKRLLELVPKGLEAKITFHGGGRWARANPKGAAIAAVRRAYEEVLDKPCLEVMSGGSIPITASLVEATGADVVFLGMGLATDNIHAPNEHYGTGRLLDLACILARSLQLLASTLEKK